MKLLKNRYNCELSVVKWCSLNAPAVYQVIALVSNYFFYHSVILYAMEIKFQSDGQTDIVGYFATQGTLVCVVQSLGFFSKHLRTSLYYTNIATGTIKITLNKYGNLSETVTKKISGVNDD